MKTWIAILALLLWGAGAAFGSEEAAYDYPIGDPLMATVAGTPAEEALKGIILDEEVYGIRIFEGRQLPPTMRNLKSYRFSLAWQKEAAPLIFIIPGTGSNYKSGKVKLLQKMYYDAGFHVICLNSTFTRRFAAMGSASRIPGITAEDAADLYRVMQAAFERVQKKITVTDFFLNGYSLGGMTEAFVSDIDEEKRVFGFRKVLLVNPPVDLYAAATLFDDYVTANLRERADTFFDGIFKKASKYFEYKGDVYIDEQFLYDINRIAPLTREDLEGLIGVAFRMSLATVLFSVDMLTDGGHVKAKGKTVMVGTSTTGYFKEALHWTFTDYLDRVLLPHWKKAHPEAGRNALIRQIGLGTLSGYLKQTEKIGVVHNADDIILGSGDLAFVRDTFGKRARIWPSGGHLGNMLYGPNVEYMVRFFKD